MRISDWSSDVCSSDLISCQRNQSAASKVYTKLFLGLLCISTLPKSRRCTVKPSQGFLMTGIPLRTDSSFWSSAADTIRKTGQRWRIWACYPCQSLMVWAVLAEQQRKSLSYRKNWVTGWPLRHFRKTLSRTEERSLGKEGVSNCR